MRATVFRLTATEEKRRSCGNQLEFTTSWTSFLARAALANVAFEIVASRVPLTTEAPRIMASPIIAGRAEVTKDMQLATS